MSFFSNTQEISVRYGTYMEEFHKLFQRHGVSFGTAQDFPELASKLWQDDGFRGEFLTLTRSVQQREQGVTLIGMLKIVAMAMAGPEVVSLETSSTIPLMLFLGSVGGWSESEREVEAAVTSAPVPLPSAETPVVSFAETPVVSSAGIGVGLEGEAVDSSANQEREVRELEKLLGGRRPGGAAGPEEKVEPRFDDVTARSDDVAKVPPPPTRRWWEIESTRDYWGAGSTGSRRDYRVFDDAADEGPFSATAARAAMAGDEVVATPEEEVVAPFEDVEVVAARLRELRIKAAVLWSLLFLPPAVFGVLLYRDYREVVSIRKAEPAAASAGKVSAPAGAGGSADQAGAGEQAAKDVIVGTAGMPEAVAKVPDFSGGDGGGGRADKGKSGAGGVGGGASLKRDRPDARALHEGHPRVTFSAGDLSGNLVSSPVPSYPKDAIRDGLEGHVVVRVLISEKGEVERGVALDGPPSMRSAAEKAMRQWRYRPYLQNGRPVEAQTWVTFYFTMGPG